MIKRGRAEVSHDDVKKCFTNYEKTAGIPAKNIFNYDETNLRDNPGAVKALFKRGVKYAEQVRDHSKTAISVMFCASAVGELVPPYVVYKGLNCYDSWCQRGPRGALYTSTKSGWFDMFTFEAH